MTSQKKQKVKVGDVAKAAGVSVATVSRAFNLPLMVREDAREKVFKAAKELGYVPNSAAKALRSQKTHIIGVVIPSLDHAIYAQLVNSLQAVMEKSGYVVYVLSCGFDSFEMYDRVKLLIERGAEGLVIVGDVIDQDLEKYILDRQIPVICTYSYLEGRSFPFIGFDNYQATQSLLQHLITQGHQNLAMITGPVKGNDRQQARLNAFIDTLSAHSDLTYCHVECKDSYSIEIGANYVDDILEQQPSTTAIVCNSDVLALGVLARCREKGIDVPKEITVVGYDNLELTKFVSPTLTTVSIPAREMGELSGKALLKYLTEATPIAPKLLETKLLIRESSGPAKQS
jgi:LacI family transcriptional regulator